jgi:hypothetical protein
MPESFFYLISADKSLPPDIRRHPWRRLVDGDLPAHLLQH